VGLELLKILLGFFEVDIESFILVYSVLAIEIDGKYNSVRSQQNFLSEAEIDLRFNKIEK